VSIIEQHEWQDEARQLAIAPRLWLWWTLATTIAGAIVGALEGSFYFQLTATVFFTGLLIGPAQWLVLRQYMPKAFWWIVVSALGWTFGLTLVSSYITLFDPLIPFLVTLGIWRVFSSLVYETIVLAILGAAQFPILRRFFRKAHWWILVSALGGALKGASSSTVAYILPGLLPPPFTTALSYGAGWLGYGIVTGICLQWLLRHHPR
jgi:hypothetical protein